MIGLKGDPQGTVQKTQFWSHYQMLNEQTRIGLRKLDAYNSLGGAHGVMVIVVGNGHGDTSSNPGRDWLHFT